MLQVISVAGLTVPVGPLAFLLAFVVGTEVASRALGRVAPPSEKDEWQAALGSAAFWALPAGLVTARLAYVIRFSDLYGASPQLLLSPRPGSLMLLPGLLGAVAVAMFILARKDIDLSRLGDALAVGVAGSLAVFYLGQYLTGAGYGLPTEMPWGVNLWGAERHPVQLYEAVTTTAILVFLWRRLSRSRPGEVFWYFVTLYSLSILVLTGFRATSPTWIQGIRIPQVVALVSLLAGLYVLSFYARQTSGSNAGEDPSAVRHAGSG